MSFKLFDVVSMEEQTEGLESTVEIVDLVAMEDADHDVEIIAGQINGHISAMEASVEAANILETKIAVEEAILDAGTATMGIAQLSVMSLQSTAALVGLNPEKYAISNESMEANPTTSLRVSIESAKETFKAIIEKIKAFFSKMWSKIKTMAAKIMLSITNFDKKFKALGLSADKLTDKLKDGVKDTYTEAEGKKIAHKFYSIMLNEGGKLVTTAVDKKYGKEIFKNSASFVADVVEGLEVFKAEDAVKSYKTAEGLDSLQKVYDGVPSGIVGANNVAISRVDGSTFKGILVMVDETEIGENKYPKVTMRSFSATGKKDILDKYSKDIKVLSVADIKNICGEGAALSKAKEDFKGYSESVLSKTDKAIGKTPKSKKEGEQDRLNALYASSLSSINVSALRFSSDLLLGYVATLKNLAYLAQVSMSKYEVKK